MAKASQQEGKTQNTFIKGNGKRNKGVEREEPAEHFDLHCGGRTRSVREGNWKIKLLGRR